MTFSILVSRHRSNFFLRDIVLLVSACSWHCSFCSFDSSLLLGMLFSPAVGCALLACCRLCSSCQLLAVLFLPAVGCALLPAVGFCHFVQLSEILVDLLLVVVQVLRLCAPCRLSGFASFVDFFFTTGSSGCGSVSVLCLLASPPPALLCGGSLLRGSPQAPPTPQLSIAPLRDHWFAVSVLVCCL